MPSLTRGTVYRSRHSADRKQTVRHISGLGTGILMAVGVALAALLLFPGLQTVFQ